MTIIADICIIILVAAVAGVALCLGWLAFAGLEWLVRRAYRHIRLGGVEHPVRIRRVK